MLMEKGMLKLINSKNTSCENLIIKSTIRYELVQKDFMPLIFVSHRISECS